MNITLLRLLFFSGVAFTAFFLATQLSTLRIATDLKDLSPEYLQDPDAAAAADELSNDIQKRMLWLIRGQDETQVQLAKNVAIEQLTSIDLLSLTPELLAFSDKIVEELLPYRFQLLSTAQKQTLENDNAESIVNKAHAELYQLGASARLTQFDQDPLAWFNAYLITQLEAQSTKKTAANNQSASHIISLRLAEGAMEMTKQRLLSQQMTALETQIKQQFEVEILRSGLFFFASDAAKKSKQDISLISSVSMLGVLILLLIAFRSLWPLILPFASIAFGVGFALSVVHSLYGSIHVLTIVFGASLIGIVIDYSLHYFYHVSDQATISDSSHKSLHQALLLSLATSIIGYSALGLSGLEALQKVAVFSCCGLSMAWLSVICLGPFATGKNLSTDKKILPKLLDYVLCPIQFVMRHSRATFIILLLIASFSLFFGGIKTSDDPRLFFNASAALLAEEKTVRQYASEYEPGRYLMISGKGVTQTQDSAHKFFIAVDQNEELNRNDFSSIFDWVPIASEQNNHHALQKSLYQLEKDGSPSATSLLTEKLGLDHTVSIKLSNDYQQAAEKILTPKHLAATFRDILPPFWFETSNRKIGLVLISKGTNLATVAKLAQSIEGVSYVNTIAATTTALSKQRQSATQLLLLAYLFVAILLFLRYRNWRSLNLLAIPVAASIGFVVLFSLTGQTITLFHTMALFLVLGLGMDYAIFAHDMQDDPDKTRQAIFVSAITSLLSFGLLGLSDIPVVKAFGLTLLIGNGLNLIGALSYSLNRNKHPESA